MIIIMIILAKHRLLGDHIYADGAHGCGGAAQAARRWPPGATVPVPYYINIINYVYYKVKLTYMLRYYNIHYIIALLHYYIKG